jgi:diaminohydroxyphosphoribosylaminopyrimidine deaminase/5-amino-6-(5-phosphoribosylamino)uracil reductase
MVASPGVTDFDRHMMSIALTMARRALGTVAPNPAVGAIVADTETGELIARGMTQPGGRPHAETEALKRAGDRARGKTVYVTLEPCAHFGKTPPCADALISSGVKRVVVGIEDPDPRTAGQGIARLRAAGIEVEAGLMADEARWVTLGHVLRVTEQRPFVQLKLALAPDGSLPRGHDGKPAWVTSTESRARGHLLRAEADAILVGSGTVRDDDPELTCRLPGLEARSPIRVVLSRDLDVPLFSRLLKTALQHPLWSIGAEGADPKKRTALEAAGAEVIVTASGSDGLNIRDVLRTLAARGITRLLIEGGPAVWQAFAKSRLVDEAIIFQAGSGGGGRQTDNRGVGRPGPMALLDCYASGLPLTFTATRRTGGDEMHIFRRDI